MDSLAGYESDAEAAENGLKEVGGLRSSSPEWKDPETNYDSVPMDESDQEMNNNVEEYYAADIQDGVNPEDAPLVFRSVTQPRNDIRTTPLHRSSSDMEVDDSDGEEFEEEDLADTSVDEALSDEDEALPEQYDKVQNEHCLKITEKEPTRNIVVKKEEKEKEEDLNEAFTRLDEKEKPVSSHTKRSRRARSLEEERSEPKRRSPTRSPSRKVFKCGDDSRRSDEGSRKSVRWRDDKTEKMEEVAFYRSAPARGRPVRNPMLQIQKKKLLWAHKTKEVNGSNGAWDATVFKNDFDGKMADKFKRLMGIKNAGHSASVSEEKKGSVLEEQEEMLCNMEAQYQQARLATHMQRGCGLGYGSHPSSHPSHLHPLPTPPKTSKLPKSSAASTTPVSSSNT